MYRNILLPVDGSELSRRAARHGIKLLLGSETLKVLTHGEIPVLVCRRR